MYENLGSPVQDPKSDPLLKRIEDEINFFNDAQTKSISVIENKLHSIKNNRVTIDPCDKKEPEASPHDFNNRIFTALDKMSRNVSRLDDIVSHLDLIA